MRKFVAVSLKLSGGMSVIIALVTSLMCAYILHLMQTPEAIFSDAYIYLLVTFLGVPCTFYYNLLSSIIRALGDSKTPFWFLLFSTVLNILLDLICILVFGWGVCGAYYNLLSSIIRALGDSKTPFWFLLFSTVLNILLDLICILVFGWGVCGAAVATVFSQGVSAVLCYFYMNRKFEILQTTPSERRFRWDLAKQLLLIGAPMGLQFSITAIGSIMLQSANNALGTACVAAFTAAMRIKMFGTAVFYHRHWQHYVAKCKQRFGNGLCGSLYCSHAH